MQIGVIYREESRRARELATAEVEKLIGKGYSVKTLDSQSPLGESVPAGEREWAKGLDLVVVFGGDGTLLRAAHLVVDRDVLVLGVNAGGLGFLTEVRPEELELVLEKALQGQAPYTERDVLSCEMETDSGKVKMHALNEVSITCAGLPRVIDLETRINNVFVTSFRADGLLVSSATGSTAYCMAAGGPIVHPDLSSIIITPLCPHTLTSRPLVIPGSSTITVTMQSDAKTVHVTADSQMANPLPPGRSVTIKAAEHGLKLVSSPSMSYYEILRTKLRWGER